MKCRILMTYDVPDWAFHQECLDLMWFLQKFAPGEFGVTVARGSSVVPGEFDVVYSSAYYDLRLSDHPRSVTQLSSYSFWERPEDGWPEHLLRWKWLATKNAGIHDRLDGYHPRARLLYHQVNPEKWPYGEPGWKEDPTFWVGYAGHRQVSKGFPVIEEAINRAKAAPYFCTWEGARVPPEGMPAFYHGLDAYCCMSKQEGGPRTGLEAMLSGAPLVTTEVGQVGEMVEDGVTALVVERTVDALVDALQRLKADPDLGKRLAWNARQMVYARVMRDGERWAGFFREVRDS